MLPEDLGMEGCPERNTLLYLILSALFVPCVFIICKVGISFYRKAHKGKKKSSLRETMKTVEFAELQLELFGEKALKNLSDLGTNMSHHDMKRIASTRSLSQKETESEATSDDGEQGPKNLRNAVHAVRHLRHPVCLP